MDKKNMGKIIRKDQLKFLISFLLLIFSLPAVYCHAATRDIELLNTGYGYYLSYQPKKAAEEFRNFLKEFPQSSSKDTALYWLGMSLIQLKEIQEAKKIFSDLKQQFPSSPFSSYVDKELEKIGKAEYQPPQTVPSQGVKSTTDEKAESKGDPGQNIEKKTNGEKESKDFTAEEEKQKTKELKDKVKELDEAKKNAEQLTSKVKELEGEKKNARGLQDKVKELEGEKAKAATLEAKVKELEQEKRKAEDLQAKIKKLEKEKAEEAASKAREVEEAGKKADELRAKSRELDNVKEKAEKLQKQVKELEGASQKAQELQAKLKELDEANKTIDALQGKLKELEEEKKKTKGLQAKVIALNAEKEKMAELQAKIRELEGKQSSLLNSSVVLNKLGRKDVLWRSGNIPEDLVNETILYQEAKKLDISGDMLKHKALTEKFRFNREQEDYLERYLTICHFIDLKLQDTPAEDVFEELIVEYDEDTKYTKIVLAAELQKQAKNGMSFEEISNLYPDLLTYKISGFDELPDWIQEKVSSMQAGDLGVIWSEDGYRILKRSMKKIALQSCEEIRPETKDKIKAYISDLLKEIKGAQTKSSEEQNGG
jgi:TolA-binding protein